jgi:hypothetical protein
MALLFPGRRSYEMMVTCSDCGTSSTAGGAFMKSFFFSEAVPSHVSHEAFSFRAIVIGYGQGCAYE